MATRSCGCTRKRRRSKGEGIKLPTKRKVATAVLERGRGVMAVARAYVPPSDILAEQFSQYDGAPSSASDLTWSYAAFVTACASWKSASLAMKSSH